MDLALAQGIHPELAEHDRLRVRDHLQAGQVIFEGPWLVQVDVEREEIEVPRPEEFRRRIVAHRAEAVGIDLLGGVDQLVEELLHLGCSAPAGDVRGDLVHDAEGEDRGMASALADGIADGLEGLFPVFLPVEKAQPGRPRDVDQKLEVELLGHVQKPPGRGVVDAEDVGPEFPDQLEVRTCPFGRGEEVSRRVGLEGPVGEALDVELPRAEPEELPVHRDPVLGVVFVAHGKVI